MLIEYDKKCKKDRGIDVSKLHQPGSYQRVSSYLCFIMGVNKTFRRMVTTLNLYFLQACGVHMHPLFTSMHLKHVSTIVFSRSLLNKTMDYLNFSAMSLRWVNIRDLRLDYCHDVGAALRAFVRFSPSLNILSLRYCEGINHYANQIQSFKCLSDLIVDGSDITFETSQQLRSRAPDLRISMRYCENLGEQKQDRSKHKKKPGSYHRKNNRSGFFYHTTVCGVENEETTDKRHGLLVA